MRRVTDHLANERTALAWTRTALGLLGLGVLLVKLGDAITVGQVIARSKGIFGFGKKEVASSAAGTVESVSTSTGQLIVRGAPIWAK